MRQVKFLLYLMIMTGTLTACLENDGKTPSTTSAILSSTAFDGATKAVNRSGSIEVSWAQASISVAGYRIYRMQADGSMKAIQTTPSTASSIIDGQTTAGEIYSYIVKAFDTSGVEDSNKKIVSALSYPGILDAQVLSKDTVSVSLPGVLGSIDEVRIYAEPVRGGQKIQVATVQPGVSSYTVTGLNSGMTYSFSAQSYSDFLGGEDMNETVKKVQTQSESFTISNFRYRGVLKVQAFGEAPHAPTDPADPSRIPKTRRVSITWLPFLNATSITKYKLVRTLEGNVLDMTSTAACTDTLSTSCEVCTVSGSQAQTCVDISVAGSPARYEYAVALVLGSGSNSWVEELPEESSIAGYGSRGYRMTVPIPPANMVLVQRDSVNYETCSAMLKTNMDPLNHQRCSFNAMGARTGNSGPGKPSLNLDAGYFDFGYNLFVDRWELGCRFTTQANGGKCGVGGTSGDCVGNGYPLSSIGVDGNVYWNMGDNGTSPWTTCLVRKNSTWYSIGSQILSVAEIARGVSSDPRPDNYPLGNPGFIRDTAGMALCNAIGDLNYGVKRIPRLREQRAYAAWPWIQGEPDYLSFSDISVLENSTNGHAAGVYACNTQKLGRANLAFGNPGRISVLNSVSDYFATGNDVLTMLDSSSGVLGAAVGSLLTSKCVSRYGVQDAVGNFSEVTSNNMDTCNSATSSCISGYSGTDSGNSDMATINFNGVQGWAGTAGNNGTVYLGGNASSGDVGFQYFNVPLGIPFVDSASGEHTAVSALRTTNHDLLQADLVRIRYTESNSTPKAKIMSAGGNWGDGRSAGRYTLDAVNLLGGSHGVRCVLPAE